MWLIGPTAGSDSAYAQIHTVEFCAEKFVNASWYDLDGLYQIPRSSQMRIKCLDDIECSCKNLDISGFEYQYELNGIYVANNLTVYERKCFTVITYHKILKLMLNRLKFMFLYW